MFLGIFKQNMFQNLEDSRAITLKLVVELHPGPLISNWNSVIYSLVHSLIYLLKGICASHALYIVAKLPEIFRMIL